MRPTSAPACGAAIALTQDDLGSRISDWRRSGAGPWPLELGPWPLALGTWNLELGTWSGGVVLCGSSRRRPLDWDGLEQDAAATKALEILTLPAAVSSLLHPDR